MRSAIWQRAQQSPQRLTETPFHLLAGDWLPVSVTVPGVPLVIAGAIDLAFREAGGWVVVDYKTDSAPTSRVAALVDAGVVRPAIDRRIGLAEVPSALDAMVAGQITGKVAIRLAA